jgi:predicted DsbA family dithiol-disulfide isomerase
MICRVCSFSFSSDVSPRDPFYDGLSPPQADAFHNAVFRAYFVDGKNLFEIKTLAVAADSVGLNGADLEKVLRAQDYKTAVDQDWLRSHELDITAVPTFRLKEENIIGAQPYERLAVFLVSKAVAARKSMESI